MGFWLKQSTAVTVKVGPFLDSSDGDTTEEALTISQVDIRVSKNGGAFAQSNNAAGATHDENGWYGVPLDTTDTGTLGTIVVAIHESGALAVWVEFMVVPANVWDSLFGADRLQVDVREKGDSGLALTTQEKADVNTEADTALTDYDAPTKAEMDVGHGLLATEAKQDIIDTVVDAIKAATDLLPDAGALNDLNTLATRLTAVRAGYLDELAAANLPADVDTLLARLTAARAGYLDSLNGHVAQTGDSYVRLGAPAGASIAADLVAIDNFVDELETRLTAVRAGYLDELAAANIPADIDTLLVRLTAARAGYIDNLNGHTPQTGDNYARLGAPAGASISADVAGVPDAVLDEAIGDAAHNTPGTFGYWFYKIKHYLLNKKDTGVSTSGKETVLKDDDVTTSMSGNTKKSDTTGWDPSSSGLAIRDRLS